MATEKLIWISPVTAEGVPKSKKENSIRLEMNVLWRNHYKQMEDTVQVKGGEQTVLRSHANAY